MKKTPQGMVKNAVASAPTGAPVQTGNKSMPALNSKGVAKGKTAKNTKVENKVASGKGSPANQQSAVQNGSTNRGQSQQVVKTKGGIGTPGKMLGLDDGALKNVSNHGHGDTKQGSNRFDLYSQARK